MAVNNLCVGVPRGEVGYNSSSFFVCSHYSFRGRHSRSFCVFLVCVLSFAYLCSSKGRILRLKTALCHLCSPTYPTRPTVPDGWTASPSIFDRMSSLSVWPSDWLALHPSAPLFVYSTLARSETHRAVPTLPIPPDPRTDHYRLVLALYGPRQFITKPCIVPLLLSFTVLRLAGSERSWQDYDVQNANRGHPSDVRRGLRHGQQVRDVTPHWTRVDVVTAKCWSRTWWK